MALSEHYALLASRVVSTVRPEIEQKVTELTHKYRRLNAGDLRLRLWIVEATIVLLAGESSTADEARLEQFFGAFWSDVSKQLLADFPGRDVLQDFDTGMDRLTAEIASDRQQLAPEKASLSLSNRITAFLEISEQEPLEYGYKLSTSTKFLDNLPE